MHLLYVFPEPLPLQKARAIQVAKTVTALCEAGVRVSLAYVSGRGGDPLALGGTAPPANLTLLPLSRQLAGLPLKSGALFAWRLRRWLAGQQRAGTAPEVVFVRHLKLASRLLRAGFPLPLVYEAHEIFADGATGSRAARLAALEGEVLRRADTVIAITGELVRQLRQRFQLTRPMPVLPSATDVLPATAPKDWSVAGRHIVYAGSLYGWKGVDDLVAAAALLPADVRITIIGGSTAEIARLQANRPADGAEIVFLGHLPHAEVLARLAGACIAILPNRAGSVSAFTSPLKLFEYMACGCALVVSDLPVFREVLGAEDAAWFAAGEPAQLAAAIRRLVDDPATAGALSAKMRVMAQQYTWPARAEKLRAILEAQLSAGAASQ